jgi:N-acyl-L-homoserine lactone synthetase
MALRLLVADSPAEKDAAREVEAQVFLEAFGNTPETMEQEYGPYADRSRFVTVLDDSTGTAVGAARIIVPDATGEVKTLTDVAAAPWHLPVPDSLRAAGLHGFPVWDSATLAVDPRYRRSAAGAEVTLALVHGLHRYTRLSGIRGAVTVLDDSVLRSVQAIGVPWTPLPGATSRYYLGSPASTPCYLVIGAYAESIRSRCPDLAPALVDGAFRTIDLDPADLLPGRGVPQPAAPGGGHDRAPAAPDRGAGWAPPAYRGSRRLSGSPNPVAEAGQEPIG